MASKKYIELQDYSLPDLRNELSETRVQFQRLKFDHATKGLDNPLVLREVRRDIARLQTAIRQREMSEMTEEQLKGRSRIRARRRNK